MTRRGAAAFVLPIVVGWSVGARAQPDDELAPVDDDEEAEEPRLIESGEGTAIAAPPPIEDDTPKDHHKQIGVGLQIPLGFRLIAPYDGEWCGQEGENENANAEVCLGRTPVTFDFEFAYGVKPNLEVLLEVRLGLERDFGATTGMTDNGPRLFHWSPGVKFYFSEAKTSKLFSTAQVVFDHTSYDQVEGFEFALRNVNGLQFDLHPSYGLYVFVGEEMAFRRWFSLAVEAGLGIQGRYP